VQQVERQRWTFLSKAEGTQLNPCNSPHHPVCKHAGISKDGARQMSIQEAYQNPASTYPDCGGGASLDGLQLKSYRAEQGGLQGVVTFSPKFQAFPGIVRGGAAAPEEDDMPPPEPEYSAEDENDTTNTEELALVRDQKSKHWGIFTC